MTILRVVHVFDQSCSGNVAISVTRRGEEPDFSAPHLDCDTTDVLPADARGSLNVAWVIRYGADGSER